MPGSTVQTFAEAGYPRTTFPRFNVFYVSAKTPEAIQGKLVSALKKVATHPEVIKKWELIGLSIDYKTPAEFIPIMKEKWDALSVLIEDLGLRKK
jgi:tripartite-type tricarboxylate transporter receptor subunit TctC